MPRVLRYLCQFSATVLIVASPWILWRDAQSSLGFSARFYSVSPATPSGPRSPILLRPGLKREEYSPKRGILDPNPRFDTRLRFDFSSRPGFEQKRVQWDGWLLIEESGSYGFDILSDDGSQLIIDGRTVVANWGGHAPLSRNGWTQLTSGWHAIHLDYYQIEGAARFQLRWQPPGGTVGDVPERLLFHEPPLSLDQSDLSTIHQQPIPPDWTDVRPGLVYADFRDSLAPYDLVAAGTSGSRLQSLPADGSRWRLVLGCLKPSVPGKDSFEVDVGGRAIMFIGSEPKPIEKGFENSPDEPVRFQPGPGPTPFLILIKTNGVSGDVLFRGCEIVHFPQQRVALSGRLDPEIGPLLLERHDTQIDFEDPVRLHIPYFHRRSMIPAEMADVWPLAHGIWEGHLFSTGTDTLRVSIRSSGRVRIQVGDQEFSSGDLPQTVRGSLPVVAGWNPIWVEWTDPSVRRDLKIEAALGHEPLRSLGRSRVHTTARRGQRRMLTIGFGLALLILLLIRLGGGSPAHRAFVSQGAIPLTLCFLALVGLGLRLYDYEIRPFPGNVDDEYNHHIIGHSLARFGMPVGWDFRDHYETMVNVPIHGRIYKMAVPFVFYPPIYSTIVASVSTAAGYPEVFDTPLHVTRLIPIFLSIVTLLLIYPLGIRLGFDRGAALLATAHFATFPFFIVNHRLVKEENLVALLYVALLLVLVWYPTAPSRRRRTLAGALIVAAILTKQMAIALPAVAFLVWGMRGHWRAAILMGMYAALGIATFILYGCSIHPDSFLKTQLALTQYGMGLDALYPLITQARIIDTDLMPTMYGGLFIVAFMALARQPTGENDEENKKTSRRADLLTALALYLVAVLLAYSPKHNYSWYRLPIFPLLSLCWGAEALTLVRRLDPARTLLFTGLFLLPALQELTPPGPMWDKTVLRSLTLIFVLPSFFVPLFPTMVRRTLSRSVGGLLIVVCLVSSACLIPVWERIDPYYWPPDPGGDVDLSLSTRTPWQEGIPDNSAESRPTLEPRPVAGDPSHVVSENGIHLELTFPATEGRP